MYHSGYSSTDPSEAWTGRQSFYDDGDDDVPFFDMQQRDFSLEAPEVEFSYLKATSRIYIR